MPFKSEKQRRYMWVHHPKIARRWTEKYGSTPENDQKRKAVIKKLRKVKRGKKK